LFKHFCTAVEQSGLQNTYLLRRCCISECRHLLTPDQNGFRKAHSANASSSPYDEFCFQGKRKKKLPYLAIWDKPSILSITKFCFKKCIKFDFADVNLNGSNAIKLKVTNSNLQMVYLVICLKFCWVPSRGSLLGSVMFPNFIKDLEFQKVRLHAKNCTAQRSTAIFRKKHLYNCSSGLLGIFYIYCK